MISTHETRLDMVKQLLKILLGPRWAPIIAMNRERRPVDVLPPGMNYEPKEWFIMKESLRKPTLNNIWALEEIIERYSVWTSFSAIKY